jgi:hypothetical protein
MLDLRRGWRHRGSEQNDPANRNDPEREEDASDTLDSNDRIRAEAPDDLETRRRADQLEREVKHRTHERRS